MASDLQWFRLYHRVIDDEKIRLLAFEDRWHFIAICCLKADGLLDEPDGELKWRKVAIKLGVQLRELDEIKRRLCEVGLVTETFQPVSWNELQYRSDSSTDRVRKYREKQKKAEKRNGNNSETVGNVSVTGQEAETESDIPSEANASSGRGAPEEPPAAITDATVYRRGKEVLGRNSGGQITKLFEHCKRDWAATLSMIEQAAAKADPPEWIGGVMRRSHDAEMLRRGFARG